MRGDVQRGLPPAKSAPSSVRTAQRAARRSSLLACGTVSLTCCKTHTSQLT